jgi:GH18 family chitinase
MKYVVDLLAIGLASAALACAPASPLRNVGPETTDRGRSPDAAQSCRPQGLYQTPDVAVPYCDVYDSNGREVMGPDHPRRVVGYFASWRTDPGGRHAYLVSDIPWDVVTHVVYAFANIDSAHGIMVENSGNPSNPAIGMEWPDVPGAELDPALPFKGHFNLLSRYKRSYPGVRTLISVGGGAATGGYVDNGSRVASGGFYSMTTLPDGSVNNAGIDAFSRSVVDFLRRYDFDGVDIDYEYPTTTAGAGSPLDQGVIGGRRHHLAGSFVQLMKTLRVALDQASAEDGRYYLLTASVPASAYVLRGMETYQASRYVDFVNIMGYDMHGAWNERAGHAAPLFDTGEDPERGVGTPTLGGIGFLNADWAYHYYRGALAPGRINLGIPYFTRGWRGVEGGDRGLWGQASPGPTLCDAQEGVGRITDCGPGAVGIDDLWTPRRGAEDGGERQGDGLNPLWHSMNLENGILPDYLPRYGLDAADQRDQLTGTYRRYFDEVARASWLWNEQKRVVLSGEDAESLSAKLDYIVGRGIGGIALWELSGDYGWEPEGRDGRGQYGPGTTLTVQAYERFATAPPYQVESSSGPVPMESVDLRVNVIGFPPGDEAAFNFIKPDFMPVLNRLPSLPPADNGAVRLKDGDQFFVRRHFFALKDPADSLGNDLLASGNEGL